MRFEHFRHISAGGAVARTLHRPRRTRIGASLMRPALTVLLAATLALPIPGACAAPTSGAETEAGQGEVGWTIEADPAQRAKQRVQFGLTRRTANHRWMHSNTRPLANLTGLTAAQLGSDSDTRVAFRLERDAGTIRCEGVARRWQGKGECRFEANAAFAAALAERGHGRASDGQLFSLALYDLGYAWLDEMKRQGYARPTVTEIVRAGDHGTDLEYLKGMGGRGYRVGSLAALIDMRDHGVTPDYVSELARLGIGDLSADEVVRLRDHGVTPDFVAATRTAGYDLEAEQLTRLRDHGVAPDFLSELKELGYAGLGVEEVVRLRDHGVTADFIRRVNASGGGRRSTAELVALRDGGWAER
jgi:hypothetical protein